MPESRKDALARAKRLNFPKSSVVKSNIDNSNYIAPRGVTTEAGKKAYADTRARGKGKEESAKIAHSVEKKARNKK